MTYSILARDAETGALGGAAATGSLCVGGWVLRGDSVCGLSASQGAAPSTFWGEDVLAAMREGEEPAAAVARITGADRGRDWRQLSALDRQGRTAAFTGDSNTRWRGSVIDRDLVVAGNLLVGPEVLEAVLEGYRSATGGFAERLIAALAAGETVGGDSRGLQSAALLVVSDDAPPLTLRVDWAEAPVQSLQALYQRTRDPSYATWLPTVPTRADRERGHG
ncbi:MAG: DUF1028 domain-containing protein [Limimaricola sp.]|uniref:DUF1028 domain-containing protein n=1 Tax=Limimaricola sp. TaxID=2211665 RepID=UPI001D578E45|nr:DUF1028 domain-containing protein [Limimaricola sp.]MBI1417510.1 DUF1028 domain-containing protein [Limimaricola sp.]